MIYKLFAEKDTTIYSYYPLLNAGMDEILEMSLTETGDDTSRILLKFDNNDINNIVLSSSDNYKCYLKLHKAEVYGLTDGVIIDIFPLVDNWYMGTGRSYDYPLVDNGASWNYALYSGSNIWSTGSNFIMNTHSGSGGSWYTSSMYYSSSNIPFYTGSISQSFSYYGDKDIYVDVTSIIKMWNKNIINETYLIFDPFYINDLLSLGTYPKHIHLTGSSLLPNITGSIIQIVSGSIPSASNQVLYPLSYTDDPSGDDYRRFVDDVKNVLTASVINNYYNISIKTDAINDPYNTLSEYYYISLRSKWPLNTISGSKLVLFENFTYVYDYFINTENSYDSGSNNGFLLKLRNEDGNLNYAPSLKYFSKDTHTIYPPHLEFKWDDYSFNTGSSINTFNTASDKNIYIKQFNNIYNEEEKIKVRVYSRPKHMHRRFQTSSIYTENYYLPFSSSYAIKDLDTNEYVINFDDIYTKLSADNESNYFILNMNGLQPQRYYQILIKVKEENNINIINSDNYFKII